MFVRMKGLEPPRLTPPDPKSGAATNYATSAFFRAANIVFFLFGKPTEKLISNYSGALSSLASCFIATGLRNSKF